MCPGDLGQMTGSSATDVYLSAGAACISFLCLPCTATDLPSGECVGEGTGEFVCVCVCAREREKETDRGKEKSVTA